MARKKKRPLTAEEQEVRQRQLRARRARLRAQLDRISDELGDEDDEENYALAEVEEDEEEGYDEAGLVAGDQGLPAILGDMAKKVLPGLAQIGQLGNVEIDQETPRDREGNSFSFRRHAGKVRNIKLDPKTGEPVEIDYQPEEWPPRGEKF